MNKLLFNEGGQPLHLDDIEFLQEATSSPLEALLSAWGNCILSGCEITVDKVNSSHRYSPGYIAFRGKIYRVEGGVLEQVKQDNSFYWLFAQSQEAVKSFEDGGSHPTQLVHTAQLISTQHDPEAGEYIADKLLPRLGVDFARSPRLGYSYEGTGELVEFREISRYSGILTLAFNRGETLPTKGHFALFRIAGVNNSYGRYHFITPDMAARTIDLVNGKLLFGKSHDSGLAELPVTLDHRTYVSLLISWDYEADNGQGAGINDSSSYNPRDVPPRSYDHAGGSTGSSDYTGRRRNR